MKEKAVEPDALRGFNLLLRLIRLFPYKISTFEHNLNKYRVVRIQKEWNSFWVSIVFDRLDSAGYTIPFDFPYHPRYDMEAFYENSRIITKTIFEFLEKIELKPKKDTYYMTREFSSLRLFFNILFLSLTFGKEQESWSSLINTGTRKAINMFEWTFGILHVDFTQNITTSDEFRDIINKILEMSGYGMFSLNTDGILRHFEATAEEEEKKRAYDILGKQKFENVITELDNIYDIFRQQKYNDALAACRIALESFYKRFLINHGIKTLHDLKNTEDGNVSNLAQTIKNNINTLFTFPSYSQNLDSQGIPHLIESSKFMISGLANPGGSHGKSTKPTVKKSEVKAAESFLILLINTLLPFEK